MTTRLKEISKDWQLRLRRFFDSPLETDATPLEICQAVLDDVETNVQPLGRGRRAFPYNRLVVRIRRPEPAPAAGRPTADAAFATLPARVRERLNELQCGGNGVEVKVAFLRTVPAHWREGQLFAIDYHTDPVKTLEVPRSGSIQVVVVKGSASSRSYSFTEPVISIGRTADPADERGHVRRNRVVFLDKVDGITETVGRAHARLRFEPATGDYYVMDEGSSNGTMVVRGGSAIPVPPRDPRGVRLQGGDELQVGRAVLRIVLNPQSRSAGRSA